MDFNELKNIISDFVQVGYMTAVQAYEPPQDVVRKSDVKKWLKMMNIDYNKFKNLVDIGTIKARRLGTAKNSPLYYSKKEIKQALATAKVSKILTVSKITKL